MNHYNELIKLLKEYYDKKGINLDLEIDLQDASLNMSKDSQVYLYTGKRKLNAISMDNISQNGQRKIYGISDIERCMNTVDAFFIDNNNDWYFVEFKDCKLKSKKDNIEKKGLANWLMLLDIFYSIGKEKCEGLIDLQNPVQFAKDHLIYIVVCSSEKDTFTYEQVKNCDLVGEVYTPPCLYKFKDYLFKNAYAYTEDYFEQRFVKKFKYE